MKLPHLLIAACLCGCSTPLIIASPPVKKELLTRCDKKIADPLTTGDQYDSARALNQAIGYGETCAARQAALADAIEAREHLMQSLQTQLQKK